MNATVGQHRKFHGVVIRDACISLGIEATKENIEEVKAIFKKYLRVPSVSALDDRTYGRMIAAVQMLLARELGIEVPISEAEQTMEEILKRLYYDTAE